MRAAVIGADRTKVTKSGGSGVAEPFQVGYGGLDVRASLHRLRALPVCGGAHPWDGPGLDPEPIPTPTAIPPIDDWAEDQVEYRKDQAEDWSEDKRELAEDQAEYRKDQAEYRLP